MSSNNDPDLTSILRTLSAFSNQQNISPTPPASNHQNAQESAYEPSEAQSLPTPTAQSHPQPQHHIPKPQPPPNQPHSQPKSSSQTITTWPPALRHVMHTVGQSSDIQTRIRFLIQRQHDHEKQWWKGREALLEKQSGRKEKKRELDSVLRSVGAPVDGKDVSTAEEDTAEIHLYDSKVHKASMQMADAMLNELKALDVPFFCISRSLIASETGKQEEGEQGQGQRHDRESELEKKDQGKLSVDELVALRRRMLELLQDLCRE